MQAKKMTIHTLKQLVFDLEFDALHAGRYPTPVHPSMWEKRDKKKAFRCIRYNTCVRQINALQDVISAMEGDSAK